MKPIKDAWLIQIELNNYCPHSCPYCTRFTSHLRPDQRYNMTPEELATILETLLDKGYTGKLGIIGGEPTIHPQFESICAVVREWWTGFGRYLALWTSCGPKYDQHKALIDSTFSWIAENDKSDPRCHHHPMTMAAKDVVPDSELRAELINNCWVQREWCPSITPKGVFFCECAAAWDRLLDGPGGWDINADWLNYGPADYVEQMKYCQLCGMSVPMEAQEIGGLEKVSRSVLRELTEHNADRRGPEYMKLSTDVVDREIYQQRIGNWAPGEYTPGRAKGGA